MIVKKKICQFKIIKKLILKINKVIMIRVMMKRYQKLKIKIKMKYLILLVIKMMPIKMQIITLILITVKLQVVKIKIMTMEVIIIIKQIIMTKHPIRLIMYHNLVQVRNRHQVLALLQNQVVVQLQQ